MQHVFFDLDGTLTDSAPGITRCLEHAVLAVGGDPPPASELRCFIGTPLAEIFEALLPGAGPGPIAAATRAYREHFERVGLRENALYPGVVPMLESLREDGCALYVATAKREEDARRVLAHFGLEPCFLGVFGSDPERGVASKTQVLARGLESSGAPPRAATLVGDRHHDVDAAIALGVRALAVGWGYGSGDELRRAEALARHPREVPVLVRGGAS